MDTEKRRLILIGSSCAVVVTIVVVVTAGTTTQTTPHCRRQSSKPDRQTSKVSNVASNDHKALVRSANNYIHYQIDKNLYVYMMIRLQSVDLRHQTGDNSSSEMVLLHDCARLTVQMRHDNKTNLLQTIHVDVYDDGDYKALCSIQFATRTNWTNTNRASCLNKNGYTCANKQANQVATIHFRELELEVDGNRETHKRGQFNFAPKQVCELE